MGTAPVAGGAAGLLGRNGATGPEVSALQSNYDQLLALFQQQQRLLQAAQAQAAAQPQGQPSQSQGQGFAAPVQAPVPVAAAAAPPPPPPQPPAPTALALAQERLSLVLSRLQDRHSYVGSLPAHVTALAAHLSASRLAPRAVSLAAELRAAVEAAGPVPLRTATERLHRAIEADRVGLQRLIAQADRLRAQCAAGGEAGAQADALVAEAEKCVAAASTAISAGIGAADSSADSKSGAAAGAAAALPVDVHAFSSAALSALSTAVAAVDGIRIVGGGAGSGVGAGAAGSSPALGAVSAAGASAPPPAASAPVWKAGCPHRHRDARSGGGGGGGGVGGGASESDSASASASASLSDRHHHRHRRPVNGHSTAAGTGAGAVGGVQPIGLGAGFSYDPLLQSIRSANAADGAAASALAPAPVTGSTAVAAAERRAFVESADERRMASAGAVEAMRAAANANANAGGAAGGESEYDRTRRELARSHQVSPQRVRCCAVLCCTSAM
jgi:trimeric autotransporter adhesin